jgi:hypothetical protein
MAKENRIIVFRKIIYIGSLKDGNGRTDGRFKGVVVAKQRMKVYLKRFHAYITRIGQ